MNNNNLLNHLTPATLIALTAELVHNHAEPMPRGWNFRTEAAHAAYSELVDAGLSLMGGDTFFPLPDDALAAKWAAYSDTLHT